MLLHHNDELAARSPSPDRVIVIGGGTLGLYLAHELAGKNREVLVIEAGGRGLDNFPPDGYESTGKAHEGIRLGRARCLGGTSNLWGGQLVEFQATDFAGRDWLPDSKWPVSFEEIAPYYPVTYENLGIPPELIDDAAVFARVGGVPAEFKDGIELFLTRWLKIPSFAASYAASLENQPNPAVLLEHTVTGFRGNGGTIDAVKVVDRQGNHHWIEGGQFILASGTIEIARLLLHSAASADWDCPWRWNRNIGAFFQDHPVGRVGSVEVLDRKRFFKTFSTLVVSGHKFQPKLRLQDEALRNARILNIQAMMSFESSVSENLVYLKQFLKALLYRRKFGSLGELVKNLTACGRHVLPLMWKYVTENRILVPSSSKISLVIQGEQTPVRESRITIDPSVNDASGLPRVILDWKLGDEELRSVRDFALRCDEALQASGLARLHLSDELLREDPRFLENLRDNYHLVGGARMGESDQDGVVDRDLKVFGTSNLHVVGAATFRTTSNANTTFTALAFATRLAEHLARAEA